MRPSATAMVRVSSSASSVHFKAAWLSVPPSWRSTTRIKSANVGYSPMPTGASDSRLRAAARIAARSTASSSVLLRSVTDRATRTVSSAPSLSEVAASFRESTTTTTGPCTIDETISVPRSVMQIVRSCPPIVLATCEQIFHSPGDGVRDAAQMMTGPWNILTPRSLYAVTHRSPPKNTREWWLSASGAVGRFFALRSAPAHEGGVADDAGAVRVNCNQRSIVEESAAPRFDEIGDRSGTTQVCISAKRRGNPFGRDPEPFGDGRRVPDEGLDGGDGGEGVDRDFGFRAEPADHVDGPHESVVGDDADRGGIVGSGMNRSGGVPPSFAWGFFVAPCDGAGERSRTRADQTNEYTIGRDFPADGGRRP